MKVTVKESTMVKPMEERASGSSVMWLSSLDLLQPDKPYHSRYVMFYRPNAGSAKFFDAAVLKAALSQALVEFYPYAGRLRKDDSGRLEIHCNGQGALFVEAECDATLDELRGFTPKPDGDLLLLPTVDYSNGISTFPLALYQMTRFKCGGISLGLTMEHHVADGISSFQFIRAWCDIARGRTRTRTRTSVPPFMDRSLLAPRNPPQPRFPHIEHQPPPPLKTPISNADTTFSTFSLSRDLINALKQEGSGTSSYEAVVGHVWRCVSAARRLPPDQETKLQFPVDGRRRLRPPLPPGYFGNVNFYTAAVALCGELESNPLSFAVGKAHEAIARMDDEYLRSAVDFSELRLRSNGVVPLVENKVKCPNLGITSWVGMPSYESDFGWGKPVYGGPAVPTPEGKGFLFVDPQNEGGLLLSITLHKQHMKQFQKLIYNNSYPLSKI